MRFRVYLLTLALVVGLDHFVDPHEGSLESVKTGGVEHLLLDLGAVGAPTHQEELALEGGLRPVGVELVVVVVQAVPAVLAVALLLVEVDQEIRVGTITDSNLNMMSMNSEKTQPAINIYNHQTPGHGPLSVAIKCFKNITVGTHAISNPQHHHNFTVMLRNNPTFHSLQTNSRLLLKFLE